MARLVGESEIIQEPVETKAPTPEQMVPPLPTNPHQEDSVTVPRQALERLNDTLTSLGRHLEQLHQEPPEKTPLPSDENSGKDNEPGERATDARRQEPEHPMNPAQPVLTDKNPPVLQPKEPARKKRNGLLRVFLGENHQ